MERRHLELEYTLEIEKTNVIKMNKNMNLYASYKRQVS